MIMVMVMEAKILDTVRRRRQELTQYVVTDLHGTPDAPPSLPIVKFFHIQSNTSVLGNSCICGYAFIGHWKTLEVHNEHANSLIA